MPFQSLGIILEKKVSRPDWHRGLNYNVILQKTNEVLSQALNPAIEKYAQAVYFRNGYLTIACLTDIVAQEIKMRKNDLIEAINHELGQNEIRQIKFMV